MFANLSRLGKSLLARPVLELIPPKHGLIVATFHKIDEAHYEWFGMVLDLINNEFEFASPSELGRLEGDDEQIKKVLLTFDDGFLSNRFVAEQILPRYNVKALFFITEDFLDKNPQEATEFARQRVYLNPERDFSDMNSYRAMSSNDVLWLRDEGHEIGAHTKTHPRLSEIKTPGEREEEIVASADRLEVLLGSSVRSFAFPFGNLQSIDMDSLILAASRFDFIFSNVRGRVVDSPGRHFIFRQNLVPGDPLWLVRAMLEGRLDWKYRGIQRQAQKSFSKMD